MGASPFSFNCTHGEYTLSSSLTAPLSHDMFCIPFGSPACWLAAMLIPLHPVVGKRRALERWTSAAG